MSRWRLSSPSLGMPSCSPLSVSAGLAGAGVGAAGTGPAAVRLAICSVSRLLRVKVSWLPPPTAGVESAGAVAGDCAWLAAGTGPSRRTLRDCACCCWYCTSPGGRSDRCAYLRPRRHTSGQLSTSFRGGLNTDWLYQRAAASASAHNRPLLAAMKRRPKPPLSFMLPPWSLRRLETLPAALPPADPVPDRRSAPVWSRCCSCCR